MISSTHLILRYVAFAILATLANLFTQRLVLDWSNSAWGFPIAVIAGTLVGLLLKYVLDKRWIFADVSTGFKAHSHRFSLYMLMGVTTTLAFWATETAFWWIWRSDVMRETGAVLGLALGYVVKYNLDRSFVFSDSLLDQKV